MLGGVPKGQAKSQWGSRLAKQSEGRAGERGLRYKRAAIVPPIYFSDYKTVGSWAKAGFAQAALGFVWVPWVLFEPFALLASCFFGSGPAFCPCLLWLIGFWFAVLGFQECVFLFQRAFGALVGLCFCGCLPAALSARKYGGANFALC
jgi:hypothetical protein